ncbi:MAG: HAD family phosphatase [Lachnospiraceae bacterium]|nr:HAD family phosphatase [Lachnospiraceae bacterium]
MIKLIVTDIDGTLLTEGTSEPHPQITEAVRSLIKKGITFAFASGRSYESILGVFPELEDEAVFISNNGACVTEKGQTIVSYAIDGETVADVVKYIRSVSGSNILVTTEMNSYSESTDQEFIDWIRYGYSIDLQCVDDVLAIEEPIVKLAMFTRGIDAAVASGAAKSHFESKISVMGAGKHWVDFIRDDVDKGNAVIKLQEKLGITRYETMTFGDNLNDIGLMKCAEYGCAVFGARQEVKDAAHEVLPNEKYAVLNRMREFI